MNVILIGAGNLATNLGKAIYRSGHNILQVFSRTADSADRLADLFECSSTTIYNDIRTDADLYIVSVKDDALEEVLVNLVKGREDRLFVHTAGSMPMDIIPADRRGVFYPMQTFSKDKEVDFSHIPVFLEAHNDADFAILDSFAKSLSDNIIKMTSDQRKWLHVAAVFCCNFSNHMSTLAAKILEEHGIPFAVMLPLIEETTRKLYELPPLKAQTGPAVRNDQAVIQRHLDMIADSPQLAEIYKLLSKSISQQ